MMTPTAGRTAPLLSAFALLSLAGNGMAQIAGLSSQCTNAAEGLVSSPFATCANIAGLVEVFTASGSIVQPFNSWLQGLCSSQACNSTVIQQAQSTISSGCSSDLSSGNGGALGLMALTSNFSQVEDIACLQATSNSSFCLTDFLNNVQTSTGQNITTSFLENLVSGDGLESFASKIPKSVWCTDCNQALINKAEPLLNSSESSSVNQVVTQECGSAFPTAGVPSDVKEADAASSSSPANKLSVLSLGGLPIAAVAVSAAMVGFGGFLTLA